MSDPRYARQVIVPGVGESGQARLAQAQVEIEGQGLDAEVAALYLAGAGVGTLALAPGLIPACRALNSRVRFLAHAIEGADFCVRMEDAELPARPRAEDPVERGAAAARWVMARLFSSADEPKK